MTIVASRMMLGIKVKFYNKMNENFRMLIDQKIIKLVRIFKMKINQMDHVNDGNNDGQGGCSRV